MLSALDDGVGAVIEKLRVAGLESDTLVFFISDNGGPTFSTTAGNDPFSGVKGEVREGGIRVPFLVRWEGRMPAGTVYRQPVISLDIVPTAVAAAGGELPQEAGLDGVNLLPHLAGETDVPPHEALYWRFGSQSAIRKGNWKLRKDSPESARLFDLAEDIAEEKDLAAERPDVVRELDAALTAWSAQLAEPLWPRSQRPERAERSAK
jgi:arylsulfatase A-like enzyme